MANFLADFVTASVDAGADGGLQIARSAAEVAAHFADSFFHDALYRAAPASMEYADGLAFGIGKDDGQAICRLNAKEQTGSGGDEAIAGQRRILWRVDEANDVGVDLPQRDQRIWLRFAPARESRQECLSIPLDRRFRVIFGESEIESILAVQP